MTDRTGPDSRPSAGYFTPIASAQYVLLTTFRRDGTPVATPVHIVVQGDLAYLRTWDSSGKAKRLRHTPRVTMAQCDRRGHHPGPAIAARARILKGGDAEQAARALAGKHRFLHGFLIPRVHRLRGWTTVHYRLAPPPPDPQDRPPTAEPAAP